MQKTQKQQPNPERQLLILDYKSIYHKDCHPSLMLIKVVRHIHLYIYKYIWSSEYFFIYILTHFQPMFYFYTSWKHQKYFFRRCFENMPQIYRRTHMLKCDFNKVEKQLYWNHTSTWVFPVNLLHNFKAPFLKNTSGRLLLY